MKQTFTGIEIKKSVDEFDCTHLQITYLSVDNVINS